MFSKTVGTVTFHFEPLLIFGGLILLILFAHLIRSIVTELGFWDITKKLVTGDYDGIIKSGEKLLQMYQKYNARLSTRQIISKIEYLNFSLAISYFARSDDDQFLSHINEMNSSFDIKEFWLSLFYLRKNDFETASAHYVQIASDDSTQVYKTFLSSFEAYKQGDIDTAKSKIIGVIDQLKHPILKQIADSIIKN